LCGDCSLRGEALIAGRGASPSGEGGCRLTQQLTVAMTSHREEYDIGKDEKYRGGL